MVWVVVVGRYERLSEGGQWYTQGVLNTGWKELGGSKEDSVGLTGIQQSKPRRPGKRGGAQGWG